jgi:hypothetical protein
MGPDGFEGRVGIRTSGDHPEIRLALKELLQPLENDRVVIDQYDADWHFHLIRQTPTRRLPAGFA